MAPPRSPLAPSHSLAQMSRQPTAALSHRRASSKGDDDEACHRPAGLGLAGGFGTDVDEQEEPHSHSHSHSHTHSDHFHSQSHSHTHTHVPSSPTRLSRLPSNSGATTLHPSSSAPSARRHAPAPSIYLPLYPSDGHGQPDGDASEEPEARDDLLPLPPTHSARRSPLTSSSVIGSETAKQRHTRIHSRNLSIFFPRPGAPGAGAGGGAEGEAGEGNDAGQVVEAPVTDIGWDGQKDTPPLGRPGTHGAAGGFQFGHPGQLQMENEANEVAFGGAAGQGPKVTGRRGHHVCSSLQLALMQDRES